MTERDGWSVPASYGDQLFEYAHVREGGAGLIDLSSRGRLLVSGSEAVQFLNGLITNDVKTLGENRWMPAAFPNVQGRLIASVRIIRSKDDPTGKNAAPVFLIDTESATQEAVLKTLNRFTLAGDFRVRDISSEMALISVQGARSAETLRGDAALALDRSAVAIVPGREAEVKIIRATHTAEDGFDLFVNANDATFLWEALMEAGARPVGFDALEILRIEAGIARYGLDMDESNVVSETNLDDAVSYTKGCYVGQEIIARIKYRGHVAKKLTGVVFDQAVKIDSGAGIRSVDDKEIGRITSVTLSPHLGRTVAMGYVKYDYLAAGTRVKVVSANRESPAQIVDLPFVRRNSHTSGGDLSAGLAP
jgi:folate-binding protein YgfZ